MEFITVLMTAATVALAGIGGLACHTAILAITFGVSIPLNNGLEGAAAAGNMASGRKAFEQRWTRWNIHRTWLSLAALVALCTAWASLKLP